MCITGDSFTFITTDYAYIYVGTRGGQTSNVHGIIKTGATRNTTWPIKYAVQQTKGIIGIWRNAREAAVVVWVARSEWLFLTWISVLLNTRCYL